MVVLVVEGEVVRARGREASLFEARKIQGIRKMWIGTSRIRYDVS